jgi:hypothetical protein
LTSDGLSKLPARQIYTERQAKAACELFVNGADLAAGTPQDLFKKLVDQAYFFGKRYEFLGWYFAQFRMVQRARASTPSVSPVLSRYIG